MKQEQFVLHASVTANRKTGQILAIYFHIRKGKSAQVHEFAQGRAFADYDRKGHELSLMETKCLRTRKTSTFGGYSKVPAWPAFAELTGLATGLYLVKIT